MRLMIVSGFEQRVRIRARNSVTGITGQIHNDRFLIKKYSNYMQTNKWEEADLAIVQDKC